MTDNFISNVLNILRLIKATPELKGHTPPSFVAKWAGADIGSASVLRLCAYVQDQCDGALAIIDQSALASEAKAGLRQTVEALRGAFSLSSMNRDVMTYFPQLEAAISSFAILESVSNLTSGPVDRSELEKLVEEVEEFPEYLMTPPSILWSEIRLRNT